MNATQIKERPIIFSGAMVRAILEGRKTQTRRVIKKRKKHGGQWFTSTPTDFATPEMIRGNWPCRYGDPGDRLWVRETWTGGWESCPWQGMPYIQDPKTKECAVWREEFERDGRCQPGWKSPIFMPRWASRITVEITRVRVERLDAITEQDALAEGIMAIEVQSGKHYNPQTEYVAFPEKDGSLHSAIAAFELLWDSLNAKGAFGWDSNPWVWPIEFKVVK